MDVRYKEDEASKSQSKNIENELSEKYSQKIFKEIKTELEI